MPARAGGGGALVGTEEEKIRRTNSGKLARRGKTAESKISSHFQVEDDEIEELNAREKGRLLNGTRKRLARTLHSPFTHPSLTLHSPFTHPSLTNNV
jgi:hypothetical protein